MSLRLLFTLMGLVTALMIGAVIYTKVIMKPGERSITVGEMRSIDRVCDTRCVSDLPTMAEKTTDPEKLEMLIRGCLADCRQRLSAGRLPPRPSDPPGMNPAKPATPPGEARPATPAPR